MNNTFALLCFTCFILASNASWFVATSQFIVRGNTVMPSSDLLNSCAFPSRSRQKCLETQSNQLRLNLLGRKDHKPALLKDTNTCFLRTSSFNQQFKFIILWKKNGKNLEGKGCIYFNLQCLLPLYVDLLPHHLCYPSVARISFISVIGTMRRTTSGKPGFISDPSSSHGKATAKKYRAGV